MRVGIIASLAAALTVRAAFAAAVASAVDESSTISGAINANAQPPVMVWGDINFVQTTDVHGWLSGHKHEPAQNATYSDLAAFLEHLRSMSIAKKRDLFIFDTGDLLEGTGLSDASNITGQYVLPIISLLPYDAGSIGNHESYRNPVVDNLYKSYIPKLHGRYITSNTRYNGRDGSGDVSLGERYRIVDGQFGHRVLVLGFLYDMNDSCEALVVEKVANAVKQPWMAEALRTPHLSAIAVLSHMDIRATELDTIYKHIRSVLPEINIVFFAGHSHIRSYRVLDDRSVALESGRYFDTVGWLSMTRTPNQEQDSQQQLMMHAAGSELPSSTATYSFSRTFIDANVNTLMFYTGKTAATFETSLSKKIGGLLTQYRNTLHLDDVLGCNIDGDFSMSSAPSQAGSIFYLITKQVLPLTVAKDVSRFFAVFGTGSIRYPLYSGSVTLDDVYAMAPFKDEIRFVADVPIDIARTLVTIVNAPYSSLFSEEGAMVNMARVPVSGIEFEDHHQRRLIRNKRSFLEISEETGAIEFDVDADSTATASASVALAAAEVPSFVVTEPAQEPADGVVDVVFLEYDAARIVRELSQLLGSPVQDELYRSDVDSTTMWIAFLKQQWASRCRN